MWSEQTVIRPEAWSAKVEYDLLHESAYRSFADQTPTPDRQRHDRWEWTDAELAAATAFESVFATACMNAVKLLAPAAGPQIVTLNGDGTATVAPFKDVPTPKQHAAREAELEALRASRTDEALEAVRQAEAARQAEVQQ